MHRNARATVLTAATLLAAGCARSDFALSRNDRSYWQSVSDRKAARAVQVPPPKILPETYFAAARLHETGGQFAEAVTQYRKAIAVNHNFVEAYHRLGVLLGAMGQFAEANQALYKAVELGSKDAVLRNNLGFQLLMQEDWHGARREFAQAIELSPGFARARINLAMVLSKLGRFDDALTQFSVVLPDPDAYYNLGLMYRSQRRFKDAADAFSTTLKFNPEFTAARRQLEKLAVYLEPQEPAGISEPVKVATAHVVTEEVESQARRPVASFDTETAGDADESLFFDVDAADDSAPLLFDERVSVEGRDESGPIVFEKLLACHAVDEDYSLLDEQYEDLFCVDTPWSEQHVEAIEPPFSTAPVRKRPQRQTEQYVEAIEQPFSTAPVSKRPQRQTEQYVEGNELPCDESVVGEIWPEDAVDSRETGPIVEHAATPAWDRIVNATPTVPLSDLIEPLANSTVAVVAPRPDATGGVEAKEDAGRVAPVSTASRAKAVRKPVVRSARPVKVLPVTRFRPAKKSPARVATTRRPERLIECFADERPLPVSWNDMKVQESSCDDGVAMLRELETHLQTVRAEIKCLDQTLLEETYRLASFHNKEPVVEPVEQDVEPVAPIIQQSENFVELRPPDAGSEEAGEPVIGPLPPAGMPILVREQWLVPDEESTEKEPSARLIPRRASPDQDFDEGTVLFGELLDLCSIIANESRCLEGMEGGDGPVMSLAFDPVLEPVLPSYMPFDLLLDVVWDAHSVPEVEGPVCIADPAWCVDGDVVTGWIDPHRFSSTESPPRSSFR